jgi:hypothetical protein
VDIDALPDDQAAWDWLVEKMKAHGLTVAFLDPKLDKLRYP